MGPVAVLIGFLGSTFTKTVTVDALKMLALRALILAAVGVLLPVVLYGVSIKIMTELISWALSHVSDASLQGQIIQLSGLAAWLGENLQVGTALQIILGACNVRFFLNIIRK